MTGCRPLTDKEVEEIKNSFWGRYATRNKTLFVLGVKTGFRISELLSIRIKDIWNGSTVNDYVTVSRAYMKKKAKGRSIKLNEDAKQAVSEWIDELKELFDIDPETHLFLSQKGKAINRQQAHNILKQAFNSCELSGTVATHSLRKTFAERVRKATNGDLFKVKELLGHDNIQSTQRYLGISQQEIDRIIDEV